MKTNLIMTDERQHDNDTIREIVRKLNVRVNARLTEDEKSVMDKYNLVRDFGGLRSAIDTTRSTYEANVRTYRTSRHDHCGNWKKVDFVGYFTAPDRTYARYIKRYRCYEGTFQEKRKRIEEEAFREKTNNVFWAKYKANSSKKRLLCVDETFEDKKRKLLEELMNLDNERKEEKKRRAAEYKVNYESYKKLCETLGNKIDILA